MSDRRTFMGQLAAGAAGMAAARARAAALHAEARAAIEPFGPAAAMLSWLASYIVERSS